MQELGINFTADKYYYGQHPGGMTPISPTPLLLPAKAAGVTQTYYGHYPDVLFWEQSYDHSNGIRRGRFFTWNRQEHLPLAAISNPTGPMFFYAPRVPESWSKSFRTGMELILGYGERTTTWWIAAIESGVECGSYVTLTSRQERSLMQLNESMVEPLGLEFAQKLKTAIGDVRGSMNSATPADLIDRCREAARIILAQLTGTKEKDLTDCVKRYEALNEHHGKVITSSAWILSRLHSSTKSSEQERSGLMPPDHRDAALAVRCLDKMLRSLGWAM